MNAQKIVFVGWRGQDDSGEHPLWSILSGALKDRNLEAISLSGSRLADAHGAAVSEPGIRFSSDSDWAIESRQIPFPEELSVSAVEKLLRCPVRFLLDSGRMRSSSPGPKDIGASMGDAAHAALERFLSQKLNGTSEASIDDIIGTAIKESCAYLDERGSEAQKERFTANVKRSMKELESLIDRNGFTGFSSEQEISAEIEGLKVKGRYDLLFDRPDRSLLLDMKYSGSGRSKYDRLIEENLGFQPAAYAQMLGAKLQHPVDAGFFHIAHASASIYGDGSQYKEVKAAGGSSSLTVSAFTASAKKLAAQLKDGHAHLSALEEHDSSAKKKDDATFTDEATGETVTRLKPKCEYCPYPAFCGRNLLRGENDNDNGD